jgi:hypothetical protein
MTRSKREPRIVLWKCADCEKPSRFGPHYCGPHGKYAEPVTYVPEKAAPGDDTCTCGYCGHVHAA